FTFYSLGEEFGIDPKYQPWETKSHNAILVDDIGQGKENNQYDIGGNTVAQADFVNAYYVKGDAADSYQNTSKVSIAKRKMLFVKGVQPYLVIADDIQKSTGTGVFKWMFHTSPLNQYTIGPGQNVVVTGNRRGAKCYIKFLWPQTGVALAQTDLTGQSIDRYGRIYPYDKFYKEASATVTATNPRFVTFISAAEALENPPAVSFTGTPDNMQITVTSKDGKIDMIGVTRDNMTFSRK
ncbi:MAG: heparinase II/III family protein, partial [Mucilaginibacter sp.]